MARNEKKTVTVERDDKIHLQNELLDHIMQRQLPLVEAITQADERRYKIKNELADTIIKISIVFITVSTPTLSAIISLNDTWVINRYAAGVVFAIMLLFGIFGLIISYRMKLKIQEDIVKDWLTYMPLLNTFMDVANTFTESRYKEIEEGFKKAGIKLPR